MEEDNNINNNINKNIKTPRNTANSQFSNRNSGNPNLEDNKKQKNKEDNKVKNKKNIQKEVDNEQAKSIKEHIFEWVKTIFIAFLAAYIITNFIIVNALIPTSSMVNTLMPEDRIIASRLSYIFLEPERGDIIIFKFPDDESLLYVKRVIGIAGDTINIIDGNVYVNNILLDEPYLPEKMLGSFGPYLVPEDSYFALGDNRNNSLDSRAWQNTFVHKDKILGKAIFKYYPKLESLK
ncbi:MAG: signal peptidase I [bacterium]